jgi:flagellar hook assembly protein FlgD
VASVVYRDALAQNYPNPFNPTTTIAFSLRAPSHVELSVYGVNGARIRDLVSETMDPGNHRIQWDGRDRRGSQVASGMYFYRIVAGDFRATKKMVLMK